MKIACISDTHIKSELENLPAALTEGLKDADLILHAGDITSLSVLDELRLIAPVEAVAGNMDGLEVAKVLPEKKIIETGRFRIGLVHGGGSVSDLDDRVLRTFSGDNIDCIVFGHSHTPKVERREDILLVNPGSPTDKRIAYNSYALITVNEKLNAEIIKI
ncbi:MAG: metallophosphoesterase family protein [Nitrospirota bacterium]